MIPYHLRKPRGGDYFNGFALAVTLTIIPFGMIGFSDIERAPAMVMIAFCALLQIGVHLRFFLDFSTKRAPVEATIGLGLTIFICVVFLLGGLWVMTDLHHRMAP